MKKGKYNSQIIPQKKRIIVRKKVNIINNCKILFSFVLPITKLINNETKGWNPNIKAVKNVCWLSLNPNKRFINVQTKIGKNVITKILLFPFKEILEKSRIARMDGTEINKKHKIKFKYDIFT